jgi:hypothetical protein
MAAEARARRNLRAGIASEGETERVWVYKEWETVAVGSEI